MNEISSLPHSWLAKSLEDVCQIFSGYGFPTAMQGKKEGEIPFFKVGDISEAWQKKEMYLKEAQHYLTASDVKVIKAKPFPASATVFAKIGAAIALNRRAILSVPSLVDNNCMGVIPKDDRLTSKYLYYFMCTVRFSESSRGGIVPSIRKSDVSEIVLPLPLGDEQEKIVSKIEELFSDLDAGVAALKRAQANLKRYRAAVLKAAVEGRLTEQWRAERKAKGIETEPAAKLLERILAERRKKWEAAQLKKYADAGKAPPKGWQGKYSEPAAPDANSLPALPEGWCWATVEQCAAFASNAITDGPFGSNLKSEHYTDSGARVIRLQNIGDGEFVDAMAYVSMAHYETLQKHALRRGDLVIAMLGEKLPRACMVPDDIEPAIVKADCVKVTPNLNAVSSKFLSFYLNSEPVRTRESRNIKGVGRPRLNVSHMRQVALSLPSPDEQTEIVAQVEAKLSNIAQAETEIKRSLERAARLRQAILKRAFEGRLV